MTAQTRTHVLRSCGRPHLLQDLETQTNDQLGGALLPVATGAVPDVAGQSCCNMTPKRGRVIMLWRRAFSPLCLLAEHIITGPALVRLD